MERCKTTAASAYLDGVYSESSTASPFMGEAIRKGPTGQLSSLIAS